MADQKDREVTLEECQQEEEKLKKVLVANPKDDYSKSELKKVQGLIKKHGGTPKINARDLPQKEKSKSKSKETPKENPKEVPETTASSDTKTDDAPENESNTGDTKEEEN